MRKSLLNFVHYNCLNKCLQLNKFSSWNSCVNLLRLENGLVVMLFYFLALLQVLLLMRNLSINLSSPDFEDHVSFHFTEL